MDPAEKKALEEAMLQYVIEPSLPEAKMEDIIETDPGVPRLYLKPVSEVNKKEMDVVLTQEMDKDKFTRMEDAYGVPKSKSIASMAKRLEKKKKIDDVAELVGLFCWIKWPRNN